jgi:hypothetical protein
MCTHQRVACRRAAVGSTTRVHCGVREVTCALAVHTITGLFGGTQTHNNQMRPQIQAAGKSGPGRGTNSKCHPRVGTQRSCHHLQCHWHRHCTARRQGTAGTCLTRGASTDRSCTTDTHFGRWTLGTCCRRTQCRRWRRMSRRQRKTSSSTRNTPNCLVWRSIGRRDTVHSVKKQSQRCGRAKRRCCLATYHSAHLRTFRRALSGRTQQTRALAWLVLKLTSRTVIAR